MSYPGGKRKRISKSRKFTPYKSRRKSYTPSVPRLLGSINEKKVIDTDPATYNVSTTGTVTLINGVATGSDFTDRTGRKIMMRSVYLKGFLEPEDGLVNNSLARVMLVYDMQSNGAAPSITDILKSATSLAQLNMNNRDRFRIVMDKVFPMGGLTAAFSQSPTVHALKKFKKCYYETVFSGTTSGIASIATGSLFLVTIGNQAAGTGSTLTASVRVRFNDA